MEFRVVNPELLAVAHRDTGRSPFGFPAKLVRALKPNPAGADDRFVQHLNVLFFLEVGLDLGCGGALVANPSQQSLQIGGRKRFRAEQGSEEKKRESYER